MNRNVFSLRLKVLVLTVPVSWARRPATAKARRPEMSLVLGTASSLRLAEWSEVRPGTWATEMTSSLNRYIGAHRVTTSTAWTQ